jgi:hypothetical protein
MRILAASIALAALAGCATTTRRVAAPADLFFANLSALCGKAYGGRMVSQDAADSDMAGKALVMHVRECSADTIRIPFHVGDDRSRTWVVTRTAQGLRLKHDHRHRDGSADELSQYGGDTAAPGTATRQEFPTDAFTRQLFRHAGITASLENVWAVDAVPGRLFAYELRRPQRFFRVEFDLSQPVQPPPPPWGAR